MGNLHVAGFGEEACLELDLVGGKARNLARLTRLGLPVPSGFCLTTRAYQAFLGANDLDPLVESVRANSERADVTNLGSSAEKIRLAILAGHFPPELTSELETAYCRMGSGGSGGCRVAVRSSGTAEDLPTSSFAGMYKSVLNVSDLPSLLDAVRECWASLWTPGALAYLRRLGLDGTDRALAVIVQKMVDASISGVLFTVEPVTGNRDCLVLEACPGPGEALVFGTVIPDHYEIDRRTLRIRCQQQSCDTKLAGNGGGIGRPARESRWEGRRLDPSQIESLARMALCIEEHFDLPQDIEWAIGVELRGALDQVYVLQARPITTLPREETNTPHAAERWESPVPGARWERRGGGIVEHLPTPPSPLYATAQLPVICERCAAMSPESGIRRPAPTYALINGYFYDRHDYNVGPAAVLMPFHYWRSARRAARWWREEALPKQLVGLDALSSFDTSKATVPQLVDHLQKWFEFNAAAWDTVLRASRAWIVTEPLFRHIFERFVRPITGGEPVVFLRGFDSQTMAGERAQQELVRTASLLTPIGDCIRQHPPEEALKRLAELPSGRSWLEEFHDYCRRYGHVTTSYDYLYPTAADDPVKAMVAIRFRLEMESVQLAHELAVERDNATKNSMAKLSGFPFRKALFRRALQWAQEGAAIREDVFFYALRGWPLARRAILALGKRLVEEGAISCLEDVFFLTWEELQQTATRQPPGDWRATVFERRREHQLRMRLSPPPWVPVQGPPETLGRRFKAKLKQFLVGATNESRDGLLRGAPVSPGKATGPARILHSPAEFGRLRNGDILVTPSATPEWTPTFAIAGGLVTDAGGPLSHSSIIAREFGIPSVMGVQVATRAIAEGQLVTIDGGEGLIQLH